MGALLLQIGVNLANDYFDYVKGVDSPERLGPVRVTQSGLISPVEVRRGMIAVLGLAVLVGLYLVQAAGWPVVVIGLASILGALAYSGGPYPLASHGLGDLFVLIFFGLVAVGGTYYVQTLTFKSSVALLSLPVGFLITAILVVNNLRDIETDRQAGKNTLAVFFGCQGQSNRIPSVDRGRLPSSDRLHRLPRRFPVDPPGPARSAPGRNHHPHRLDPTRSGPEPGPGRNGRAGFLVQYTFRRWFADSLS